ncbi:MAG: tyrosine-protein phosphatase [Erysipelotrichaceae bacterium]|nr:tyrosine-protein phosphatase [Erysipelotrichaceae bacterium]
MKKILMILMAILICTGCTPKEEPVDHTLAIEDYPTIHETEFGGVYIEITIDDFNELGFAFGDSVDVEFSNGYRLEDIPYYNGYYVQAGEPLLVGYPGYDYIKAAINYGDDLWETGKLYASTANNLWLQAALDEHCTATVRLREKAKYLAIQGARDIHYYDERERYESDTVFANFRNIRVGNIKENSLYRSASPCDNSHQRAHYVDALISNAKINGILNLSDDEDKIEGYIEKEDFQSPYFLSLYENGKVFPIALSMNYLSDVFAEKIAQGLIMLETIEGPYLIHCTEGKDRTGFVCMLVEALCGASYQGIADDYMLTYANYYDITKEKEPDKYQVILEQNIEAMVKFLVNDDNVDYKTADLSIYARNYLLNAGMEEAQIDAFISRICE